MDAILATIDKALRQKGLTDSAASKLAVGHPSLLKNLRMPRDGEKRYNLPSLMRLAEVLDLEFYFGPRREGLGPSQVQVISNLDPDYDAPSGFIVIPWHSPGLRAGSAPVAFSRGWLLENDLVPDFLQAIIPDRLSGPIPHSPDTVALVDTRTGSRKGADLWCYREVGQTIVGRITFSGSMAAIHPVERDGEVRILEVTSALALGLIGRVVWLGQTVPLKGKVG